MPVRRFVSMATDTEVSRIKETRREATEVTQALGRWHLGVRVGCNQAGEQGCQETGHREVPISKIDPTNGRATFYYHNLTSPLPPPEDPDFTHAHASNITQKMPFTDQEWEEVSQEVPTTGEPFIQQYIEGRERLIAQEATQRSDASFRQSLSPLARRACAILEDELAKESENITVHPGMMFSLSKDRMEQTKLWQIVRRMPKGSLLHAHIDAMVDFKFLLDVLMKEPGMHISADMPLTSPRALENATLLFRFFKTARTKDSLYSKDYAPGTFIRITQAADAFPDGGREGFLKWVHSRCTLSRTDAVAQHHGVDEIWTKFYKCFRVVNSFLHHENIYRQFLRRLMHLLKDDGIMYAELRFAWGLDYYQQGSETPDTDYVHMMDVLDEECITTKITHPHLIAGYDLVGQEDGGRPLRDLLPELFWFRKQCAEEGVNIPFFFHAGECLGSGSETDHNLYDAVLLGTRRIGHGFSLYKHPLLIDLVKEKRILIESCPISNEVLRLCGSVMSHPLPALLARGVPCCLCNDDPAMLGQDTAGCTHDFWQALQGWENLGLAGLGSLAENSIRWSAFEDQTADKWTRDVKEASVGSGLKAKRLQEWAVDWEKFCLWVVDEFGTDEDANGAVPAPTAVAQ
ncbi:adenosine/AMP deaminase [Apiospora hydei]|uniref:Adenosine/AMP deaminase n=1 Tax=Apiospora hydei TaxID=1337664 RepID=A0ABR1WXV8_9PEZI